MFAINSYKNLLNFLLKNSFANSSPSGEPSLSVEDFDWDDKEDIKALKDKLINDWIVTPEEVSVIDEAYEDWKIDINWETGRWLKELSASILENGFSAIDKESYNRFKSLVEKFWNKIPNWEDIISNTRNNLRYYTYDWITSDSNTSLDKNSYFHWVIIKNWEIQVRFDGFWRKDTFVMRYDENWEIIKKEYERNTWMWNSRKTTKVGNWEQREWEEENVSNNSSWIDSSIFDDNIGRINDLTENWSDSEEVETISSETIYTVKKWDTLFKIVRDHYWLTDNTQIAKMVNYVVDSQNDGKMARRLGKDKDPKEFRDWIKWDVLRIWDKIKLPVMPNSLGSIPKPAQEQEVQTVELDEVAIIANLQTQVQSQIVEEPIEQNQTDWQATIANPQTQQPWVDGSSQVDWKDDITVPIGVNLWTPNVLWDNYLSEIISEEDYWNLEEWKRLDYLKKHLKVLKDRYRDFSNIASAESLKFENKTQLIANLNASATNFEMVSFNQNDSIFERIDSLKKDREHLTETLTFLDPMDDQTKTQIFSNFPIEQILSNNIRYINLEIKKSVNDNFEDILGTEDIDSLEKLKEIKVGGENILTQAQTQRVNQRIQELRANIQSEVEATAERTRILNEAESAISERVRFLNDAELRNLTKFPGDSSKSADRYIENKRLYDIAEGSYKQSKAYLKALIDRNASSQEIETATTELNTKRKELTTLISNIRVMPIKTEMEIEANHEKVKLNVIDVDSEKISRIRKLEKRDYYGEIVVWRYKKKDWGIWEILVVWEKEKWLRIQLDWSKFIDEEIKIDSLRWAREWAIRGHLGTRLYKLLERYYAEEDNHESTTDEISTDERLDWIDFKINKITMDDETLLKEIKKLKSNYGKIVVWNYTNEDWEIKDVVIKWGRNHEGRNVALKIELDWSYFWNDIDMKLWKVDSKMDVQVKLNELLELYREER